MRLGCRVVRGANWRWSDQDGGIGHVGTVVDLPATASMTCVVQWDSKSQMNYRCGFNNRYDLLIFDSAPSGVKHECPCIGCNDRIICGILWCCAECPNTFLCTKCYMTDAHSTAHAFKRINEQDSPAVFVQPRRTSRKIESYGIFEHAQVKRGRDWNWADQDGDGLGTVSQVQGWSEESSRSVVCVEWNSRTSNVYRMGHRGKTDLFAVRPAKGWSYYVDHLPNFGEERSNARPPMYSVGEFVRVDTNAGRVRKLAEGHGQWHDNMAEYCGKNGTVHRITESDDIRVIFEDRHKWTYNPKAITKVFCQNDTVELTQDPETLQEYQGDAFNSLSLLRGTHGKVLGSSTDSSLYRVAFVDNGPTIFVHANCLYAVNANSSGGTNSLAAVTSSEDAIGVANVAFLPSITVAMPARSQPTDETVDEFKHALSIGRFERLKYLLYEYPMLVDCEIDGEKALIRAVNTGKIEIVRLFTQHNVNINVKDKSGNSIAHIAVQKSLDMLQMFAEPFFQSVINSLNNDRDSPLHLAVKYGNVNAVNFLLKLDKCDLNVTNNEGNMPIHVCVTVDNEAILECFLGSSRIDASFQNDDGHGPVHLACLSAKPRLIVKILTMKPALVNSTNKKGFAPLHLASFHGHRDFVLVLLNTEFINVNFRVMRNRELNSYTSLHLAVIRQHAFVVEALVESTKVELSLTEDRTQMTPLHMAVETLLKYPADRLDSLLAPLTIFNLQQIEADNFTMDNLMSLCLNCAPLAICLYLLAKGCNADIKNKQGLTALEMILADKNQKFKQLVSTFNAFGCFKFNGQRRGRYVSIRSKNKSQLVPKVVASNQPSGASAGGASGASSSAGCSNEIEGDACMWCHEHRANVRYEPCNHIVFCTKCVNKLGNQQPSKCFVCQMGIQARVGPNGEIKEENKNENTTDILCPICFERVKNMAPRCGHTLCRECANYVTDCPICRQPMTDLRMVYL